MEATQKRPRRDRGDGGLFRLKNSPMWYTKIHGKRESTGTKIKEEAKKILATRMGRASLGIREPNLQLRYGDIREGLLFKHRHGKQRSHSLRTKADGTEDIFGLKHLDAFFGGVKVSSITTAFLKDFIKKRLAEGASPSTVNRNLSLLRRMVYQAHREDPSVFVPYFPMLDEPEPRQGFLEDDRFVKLFAALPERLRTFILLLYTTGVRSGEAKKITWEHVDLDAQEIRLPNKTTKSGKPRILPLVGVLVHRLKAERKDSGRVFAIGRFHKAFWSACVKAGLGKRTKGKENGGWGTYEGLIPHDLRRSALRNMRRRGISTTVAKKISGHLTDSVFERYNITSTEDLHDAANKIEAGSRVLEIQRIGSKRAKALVPKNGSRMGQVEAVRAS